MSCGVVHRCASDLVLLWLWHRLAAVAPTGYQAWKLPYAMGAAPFHIKEWRTTDTKEGRKGRKEGRKEGRKLVTYDRA